VDIKGTNIHKKLAQFTKHCKIFMNKSRPEARNILSLVSVCYLVIYITGDINIYYMHMRKLYIMLAVVILLYSLVFQVQLMLQYQAYSR
jgi:hypothetical protein